MDIFRKKRSICIRGVLYDLIEPVVMGIVNLTPDSFYDGGRYNDSDAVVRHVGEMINEGAGIVDIGAVSTRPGSVPVSEYDELKRLSEVLNFVRDRYPDMIVSIDTFRSGVAERMVNEYGADIINDISSGTMDDKMPETIARLGVPFIAMHMQGTPQTMHKDPKYDDVVNDIIRYFSARIRKLRSLGVKDIIVDPGIGFGKTIEHNYKIAGRLQEFAMLDLPVLVGFSRKSMIYKTLQVTPVEALAGTIALNAIAVIKGADILRVHDVKEAVDTVRIVRKVMDSTVVNR
ncbi:MAG: dihydropteroate synthase [Bacteroidales bacterium]